MAAAAKTETNFNVNGEMPVEGRVTIATQNDWIVLPHPGALHIIGKNFYDGGQEATATSYASMIVNLTAGYDDDDTSIVYDNGTANQRTSGGYYVVNDATAEIMYVQVDSGYDGTSGTLTVKRGALGTTAASITDNDVLYILNTLIFTSANVGTHLFRYIPMPADPNTDCY